MTAKSAVLASQFESRVEAAMATLEKLSEADWTKVTEAEKWSVGVTAHHFARALEPIARMIEGMVAGRPGNFTSAGIEEMNATHAKEYAHCTKAETIALFRKGAATAAAVVRGLSDDQLVKSGLVLTDAPPMTAEQLITAGLIGHLEQHFGSIRKTIGEPGDTTTSTATVTAPADAERAIAVIVLAFSADPAARWTYPDARSYLTHFPAIVRAFGGKAFAHGTGCHASAFAGAALWLPPGIQPDGDALAAALRGSVAPERQAAVFGVFEQMGRYHPHEPHWYLPLIGVDPIHQRRGHGSALLQHALRQCDRDHTLAYLESTNPANVPLYERHGFRVLATVQIGSSPPIVPMLRMAR
jgi:ribosomal protein S18 acetylase RimI-like enzyme